MMDEMGLVAEDVRVCGIGAIGSWHRLLLCISRSVCVLSSGSSRASTTVPPEAGILTRGAKFTDGARKQRQNDILIKVPR